jgi:TonB family protein
VRLTGQRGIEHLEATGLFEGLVVSNPPRLRPRSRLGVGSSVVAHVLGMAGLIVLPILASEELPAAHGQEERPVVFATVTILPPPEPVAAKPLAPVAPRPVPTTPLFQKVEFTMPVKEPDEIKPEPPPLPVDIEMPTAADVAYENLAEIHDQLVRDPDVAPRLIKKTDPQFPEQAARAVQQGKLTVRIEILVDATGRVVKARVLEDVPLLSDAALKCVKEWQFEPARKRGRPVPTIVSVAVNFGVETH